MKLATIQKAFIVIATVAICIIQPNKAKATEKTYPINQRKTANATLDENGTLKISGEGIVGEGISKTSYVSSYQKQVGDKNITEDDMTQISQFWENIEVQNVKKVVIEEGITGIANDIFNSCSNLTSIEIPSTVSYMENKVYHYLDALEEIKINENNENFSSIDGVLYNKTKTQLICYPKGKKEETYNILETVTEIKELAFANNNTIEEINIPIAVNTIGAGAFRSCENLSTINVAEENTTYSSTDGILFNKEKTEIITYPSGKKGEIYTLPEGTTTIKEYAFSKNANLKVIDARNAQTIERGAFYSCTLLEQITLPENITQIGTGIFSGCHKLQEIIMPKGISKIEACTFTDCYALEEIEYKDSITEISDYAFTNCKGLTTYAVPIGVTIIGKEVFEGCTSLGKLYIPNTVQEIQSIGNSLKTTPIYCKSGTVAENHLKENGYQYQIDNQEPILYNTFSNTTQKVDITIRTIEPVIEIEGWESSIGNKKLTRTYTQNTKETIAITDLVGNTTTIEIEISDIESETPQVSITSTENEDTEAPIIETRYKKEGEQTTVTINSNEVLQEIEGWEMLEDGTTINKTYQGKVQETIEIKDLAGNITHAIIDIGELKLNVEYSTKEMTIAEVIVTIESNRELKSIEGWKLSQDKKALTKSYTENINKYITIEDFSGNIEYVDVFIENITTRGDSNKNGKIDLTDVLVTLRYISAIKEQTIAEKHPDWILQEDDTKFADIDGNEKIDITDVLKIQRYMAAEKSETIREKYPDWLEI